MVIPWDLLLSPSLRVTSGGDHRRPVQTCSFGDSDPPFLSNIWWWQLKLKHKRYPSGRYASYWNAVLFIVLFVA